MIGILLITHGTLGESLLQSVCHVLNKRPPMLAQLAVSAQDDPLDILPTARAMLNELDEGDGILIMTDILGTTPSNLTLKLLDPGRIEGIAGVSLPMILRALTYRKDDMETLVKKAVSGGRDGIINMRRQ